ncbi:MAG TPA: DUF4340 domain-containing protein, partial [Thermoguttaceae bacterium]|nr:DUF4340 domain-containing protein [Thermoguttaceae bacterium]
MNESAKTVVFVSVAAAAVMIVLVMNWSSQSLLPVVDGADMIGKTLFEEFEPLSMTNLRIVKYDQETGTPQAFEVSQVKGQMSIPSHDNYPTDAESQLADAASSVLGLEVLSFETDNPGDHSMYGVLDPTSKTLEPGAEGIGTRVTMKDKNDKVLLDLLIGNAVEGGKSDANLHYVRRAGQDPVYTMSVKTNKLSTKFEDWIEGDLLKLSAWDIKDIEIRDYTVDETRGTISHRGKLDLAYDDSGDPKWQLTADSEFSENGWLPVEMSEDEELDTDKLDALKSALDDLKIVDVRRKPAGLSADLKADEGFANNEEGAMSLMSRGFYLAEMNGQVELVSNEGEVRCVMKDGVEYVLRFGAIDTSSNGAKKEGEEESDTTGGNPNRYIFVMAEFNPDAIPAPELEALPEESAADTTATETETTGDETADAETEPASDTAGDETAADDDAAADEVAADDSAAERERIEKDNQRKQDEYDEKIEKGKKHVQELNDRFADWYYIIADDVYQKIHLGRE